MKDNKPLLFINSAQTNTPKDKNQYVYDSRFNKKDQRITEASKVKTKKAVVKEEVVKQVPIEESEKLHDEKEQVIITEDNARLKKLANKLELLSKRAKLGRYVFVTVETFDQVLEGYFMELLEEAIILNMNDQEHKILISDIKEITILKV
jgi:hypothetical protein